MGSTPKETTLLPNLVALTTLGADLDGLQIIWGDLFSRERRDRQTETETDRQTDRQTETDRQRQSDRETDRQRHRET